MAKLEKADIRRHAHEVSRLRGGAFGYDPDGFRDAEAYLDGLGLDDEDRAAVTRLAESIQGRHRLLSMSGD